MSDQLELARLDDALLRASGPLAPLCVDAAGLARMLDVSTRTIYRLADAGQLPAAINLRGCKRWYVAAVETWLRDGGPRRRSRA